MAMISLAVPTGALLEDSLDLFRRAGLIDLERQELGRRLLVEHNGIRLVLVRPSDVPAYVDHGAADLGVVGKDTLWEVPTGHYELVNLGFGGCQLVMAVPAESELGEPAGWPAMLRVGSKYPLATANFMRQVGQTVEVVRLSGSVELAPLVGLVDAIVDLTATGKTLRENQLRVVAEVDFSTARLIANQASLKTRSDGVQAVVSKIRQALDR
ncbi:MAG: ATP phosphoribosyltransferase [Candidatus Dormibacteraceae bacterium]